MSVRLVVGRAGSGKTFRCLEAIRQRLGDSAHEGGRLLLLVPEQAAFQMERALVETPGLGGYSRCEVLSFQRLAYRVFSTVGTDPRRGDQTIGTLGRIMVLRRLIRRERAHLRLLGSVADKPGLVRQVASALDELMRERVAPETLAALSEQSDESNPLQSARLADLTRIYRAYLDYLLDDRLDPAQYLEIAAARLPECGFLDGCEVWVDGFAGFTGQEYGLLVALAKQAARMEITLLVDARASAIEATSLPRDHYALFARSERTLVRLRRELTTAGVAMDAPVRLESDRPPRFARPELAALEARQVRPAAPLPADLPPARTEVICVRSFADRRAEVEAAVDEIDRLTRLAPEPLRYRDVAIILRDMTPYHDLLAAALRARDIPFFIDRRQPTTHHPLIELVRALLAIACDDFRLDAFRPALKTGLLPLTRAEADRLENYLLATGIAGAGAWRQSWGYRRFFGHGDGRELSEQQQAALVEINGVRRRLLEAFEPWPAGERSTTPMTGREHAVCLVECLQRLNVPAILELWGTAALDAGLADEADAHRQVWIDLCDLLDEFVNALGGETLAPREFREAVEAGLAEFDLGLAPPTLDQVLVGAIERSRHPAVRAVLLLGFDESHYPIRRGEDPLLGDEEREALAAADAPIGPARRQSLLDERMLAYVALTRASERLWISHPRGDDDGRPLRPSMYLQDVLKALPGLEVVPGDDDTGRPMPRAGGRLRPLVRQLAAELRDRPDLGEETWPDARAAWNRLYDALRSRDDRAAALKRGLAGLRKLEDEAVDAALLAKHLGKPFTTSISRLERFAACPFAHFAERTLNLRPRLSADLNVLELGSLCHAVLERFTAKLIADQIHIADLDDDAVNERIAAAAENLRDILGPDLLLEVPRNRFAFDRGREHLARLARWQRRAANAGTLRPLRTELAFGMGQPGVPGLELLTPRQRKVLLRGRIDRIDLASLGGETLAAVIDYKRTSERTLKLAEVFHGLSLQLIAYLLVIAQRGETLAGVPVRPAACLYLPLLQRIRPKDHPGDDPGPPYRFRGLLEQGSLEAFDSQVSAGGASQYYSAKLKTRGEPHANSDLIQASRLEKLMAHVAKRMGELADRLLDGDVSVSPYRLNRRSPCGTCAFRAVCRFESGISRVSTLEALGKPEVWSRIETRAAGDGDDQT